MEVRCDKCQARYRVDDARVGPQGLTMRCGKCKNTFKVTRPAVPMEDRQKLGIKELIESARTPFAGSVQAKQDNISLASQRLNGVVVPPGGLFSFNQALGPTTLDAGFKTGWGITTSGGGVKTVPSVAGGICQVRSRGDESGD